jgi:hypothetical protein
LESIAKFLAGGMMILDDEIIRQSFLNRFENSKNSYVRVASLRSYFYALSSANILTGKFELDEAQSTSMVEETNAPHQNVDENRAQTRVIRLQELTSSVGHVLFAVIALLENPREPARLKYDIVETVTEAVQRGSAEIMEHFKSVKQGQREDNMIFLSPFANFLRHARSPDWSNRPFVDRIWILMRSYATIYDQRLRSSLSRLFNSIWGQQPSCFGNGEDMSIVNVVEEFYPENNMMVEEEEDDDEPMIIQPQETLPAPEIKSLVERSAPPKKSHHKRKSESNATDHEREKKKKKRETSLSVNTSIELPPVNKFAVEDETPTTAKIRIMLPSREQIAAEAPTPKKEAQVDPEKALIDKTFATRKERRKGAGIWEDFVSINIGNNLHVIYAGLDDTETAHAFFRSLPFESTLSISRGCFYFQLPKMEEVKNEEEERATVRSGELAYWKSGQSLVIGHAKTEWSKGSEIRLYEKCNIFGDSIYKVCLHGLIE